MNVSTSCNVTLVLSANQPCLYGVILPCMVTIRVNLHNWISAVRKNQKMKTAYKWAQ